MYFFIFLSQFRMHEKLPELLFVAAKFPLPPRVPLPRPSQPPSSPLYYIHTVYARVCLVSISFIRCVLPRSLQSSSSSSSISNSLHLVVARVRYLLLSVATRVLILTIAEGGKMVTHSYSSWITYATFSRKQAELKVYLPSSFVPVMEEQRIKIKKRKSSRTTMCSFEAHKTKLLYIYLFFCESIEKSYDQ